MSVYIWFAVALVLIYLAMRVSVQEKFQPEFLDKTQVRTTVATEDSSYAQRTNHVQPAPYSMGPIQGMETPFQVNQYRSYIA
jgi:hypothetical protein